MPIPSAGCILSAYLAEQELLCRRMERTANVDTPHGREWHRIAEMLMVQRIDHAARCGRCRPAENGVVKP